MSVLARYRLLIAGIAAFLAAQAAWEARFPVRRRN